MIPSFSHESRQARARLFRKQCPKIEVSMKTGDGETQTASISVPEEALSANCFRNSLEDFIEDALDVCMIQVWVKYCVQGKQITETFFVPVLGWHLLSFNWQIVIEDYVQQKLFYGAENQSAPSQAKRSGPALLFYRRSGEPGNLTRKERFHDWWVRMTGRGSTIFYQSYICDWSIPMPPVKAPLGESSTM